MKRTFEEITTDESDMLMSGRFPGASYVGRNEAGALLFEWEGDLFARLPDGQMKRMIATWEQRPAQPLEAEQKPIAGLSPSSPHFVAATCLELAWGMASWQPMPGGTMVTFFHVAPPPAGVIGAEPRSIPASTVFLPGMWITRAVNDKGQVGTYAVAHGVTLEQLGLIPPPVKKPVLGEES